MALNTVELSSFITKGLGLAQPFNIQAGTLGCFCNLMAFHGKTPMPCRKLCSGAKQAVYLCHTLVPALPGCESFLLSCLTPPFSGCDIPALRGAPQCPNFTKQDTGEPSPSVLRQSDQTLPPIQAPLSVLRQVVSL